MPRSTDGTYSLPSGTLVNSGDTILVSQHNPAMTDIASALSNSLDRNGSGGMRAALNMGGNAIQNSADGSSDTDLATLRQARQLAVPVGGVIDYAGLFAPTGYLFCYGQAVSRIDYVDLFNTIGTLYGAGDNSTTFNVPDFRGRTSAAPDNLGGVAANRLNIFPAIAPGNSGGEQAHTLTASEMPLHNHGVNDPGHAHSYVRMNQTGGGIYQGGGTNGQPIADLTGPSLTGITTQNAGGGISHNNVQPTLIINKIIKASNDG